MAKKVLLGGIVGAVIVFLLSAVFHMATKLGEMGIQNLPGEGAIETAMRTSIHESGFYFFPGMTGGPGQSERPTPAQQKEFLDKYKQGPTGILIYHPGGEELNFGKRLVVQFMIGLVAAFLAAWILAMTASATTFSGRVLIITLMALFAGVYMSLPYWNWYGFPTNYTVAYIFTVVVSWLIAGFGMAAVMKDRASAG